MAATQYFEQVQKIFIAFYQRPADPAGLKYWAQRVDAAGGDFGAVIDAFASSPEAIDLYGAIDATTIGTVIDSLYMALFNAAPDAAGKAFYVDGFAAGTFTAGTIALAVLNGAQNDDLIAVQNKVQVANEFTEQVDGRSMYDAYFGTGTSFNVTYEGDTDAQAARDILKAVTFDAASVINPAQVTEVLKTQIADATDPIIGQTGGQTFTLTVNPDNIAGTAGNDTINGYVNTTAATTTTTLTSADVINGGAGIDSLKLTVEGGLAGALPNASISNVENFFIRDVATAASSYDFGAIQGEQQVWADGATNAAGVTFANLGAGTTVGLKGNNVLDNLGNVSFNMATATDAVSIAIDGGVKDGSAGTGTLATIAATAGTATAATISSTGAANTVGAVTLTAGGDTVTTLTVNAATNLTAVLTAADFAATAKLVVTGAGKVNLGAGFDGATIDASANTGGLTVSTTTGVTKLVTGSTGDDSVTLIGALAAGGKINLGAGNDKLLTGAGASITATTIVDGGDGMDSISAALINAANAGAIKNFELLDVSAASALDVELVTGSTITGLTLSGGAGGGTGVTNVAAGAGLSVTGNNTGVTTIGVKGAAVGTADTFTTTFSGVATPAATALAPEVQAAGTVVTNGIESLNVVSGGTGFVSNTLAVTDSALQTLTITGDKALGLTFVGTNGTAVTGVTDTVNGVKMIDGSAATGALTIDLNTGAPTINVANAGLTVKTGSGKDVITLAQKATVDAGAGDDTIVSSAAGGKFTGGAGNDTFNVELAVATGTTAAASKLVTITDFAAGDSIDFAAGASAAFVQTKVTLGAGVTNLDQAFAAATGAANTTQWFQYGANTYIVSDTNGSGAFSVGDTVVELVGLVDLSAATITGTVLTVA